MSLPIRTRSSIAILLCAIAAFSLAQASGISPATVSADNTISTWPLRAPASTEPSANGTVQLNHDNGQVTVELSQALPGSNYTVLFVSASASASANVSIGTIMTDQGGKGNAQGVMRSGSYVGVFEVLRIGLVQFTTANVSFTIGATASASVTISTSTTEIASTVSQTTKSESSVSVSNSEKFLFQVEPASRSITAGGFAKFDVRIAQGATVEVSANIFLVARDVPPGSVAIFTPNLGVADPEFHSTLTILTSANTPAGNYTVTAVALVNGQEFTNQIALEVSATTSQRLIPPSAPPSLVLTVTTDQSQYQPNATVTIQGQVTDSTGSAIAQATVSIQVDSPTGAEVFFGNSVQTDAAGTFHARVTLTATATLGTYTVFVTAAETAYSNVAARTTFVVGSSTTPSVNISALYAGDIAGNPISTFSVGQTVTIWVVIQNVGTTFQGLIWVQVCDPNGVPVQIGIHIANLHSGETIKDGIGFTLSNNATPGVYRVDALVSDKLISQGGSFLANAQTQFALTG